MKSLSFVLAGIVLLQACACMPARAPTATALAEPPPAPRRTVAVPATLTSNRPDAASTLILGVQ